MKLILEEMREIAKTLPVGYYLGRKVQVTIDDGGGAYCDIVKSEIHIGMGILQQAADHIDAKDAATWDRETMLRCLLYHEVGHLLLTPKDWISYVQVIKPDGKHFSEIDSKDIINIFEDERLERMLEQFFIGVKFREFVRLVNNGASSETEVHKIFEAIRLRNTTADISDAVDSAIKALSRINSISLWYDDDGVNNCLTYQNTLNDLLKKILDGPEKQSEQTQSENSGQVAEQGKSEQEKSEDGGGEQDKADGKSDAESEDESQSGDASDEADDEADDANGDADDANAETDDDGKSDDKSGQESQGDEASDEAKDAGADGGARDASDESEGCEDGKKESKSGSPENCSGSFLNELGEGFLKDLAKHVFATPTQEVTNVLNKFAVRLAKQKGAQAAGRWSALHGRIDVRRDALDKERIFRRSSDIGEKLNTSVHLTLWVDCSGSFRKSEGILNQILSATSSAMKMSNGRLTVDVVKMNTNAVVAAPNKWQIRARGDNDINVTYYDAWKSTRKKDRRNIDIVVFDGRAAVKPNYDWRTIGGTPIEKLIWDHPDCHIISDYSNKSLFEPLKKAHKRYMSSGYAEKLQEEVIKVLDRIL